MVSSFAIIGCGVFGEGLAHILGNQYGQEILYLTARRDDRILELKQLFPLASYIGKSNREAAGQASFIAVTTQPEHAENVIDELSDLVANNPERAILNFTTKHVDVKHPLVHIASWPAGKEKIPVLSYEPNQYATHHIQRDFIEIFDPVTETIIRSENVMDDFATYCRVLNCMISYYQGLATEGKNEKGLWAYFRAAANSLSNVKESQKEVMTKGGVSDALVEFYKARMPRFLEEERNVTERRLRKIQET